MTIYDFEDDESVRRAGEHDVPLNFRTNRFFVACNSWYFSTREGTDQGPFATRIIAHDAIQEYIRERQCSD